jgi:putative adhesin
MRTTQTRHLPLFAAAALAALTLPGTLHADEPFRESHEADPQGTVEILGITDSVDVTGWDQPRVELTAQGDIGDRIHFSAHGGRTVIDVRPGGGKPQLSIRVPSKSMLSVTLVNGNISVHGVAGDTNLRSVSGNIAGDVGGNLRVNTATGTIHMSAPGAKMIEAKTIDGDIHLTGSPSEVEVVTVSGNVKLELGALSHGRFKSISGNVTAALSLAPDADLDGESVSGNLRFDFPTAPAAEFDLQSFSGTIDNCFGPKPERAKYGPGSRLEFKSGEGGAHVRIETKSGDVHLCTGK